MSTLDKISDILMFREGTEEEEDGSHTPILTTGSIVWGVLLRSAIIILISFFLMATYENREYWWMVLFVLWFAAAYPGWRQYQIFQKRLKKVEDETLCGSCIHFESSGQLCKIYDEHVTKDYIPCEGLNFEPKAYHEDED